MRRTLKLSLAIAAFLLLSRSAFAQEGFLRNSFATPDEHIVEGCRAVGRALAALR